MGRDKTLATGQDARTSLKNSFRFPGTFGEKAEVQSSIALAGACRTAGTWSGYHEKRFRTSSSKITFFLKVSPSSSDGCSFNWPRHGKSIKRFISVGDDVRRKNLVTPLFASSTGESESPSSGNGAEGVLGQIQSLSDILSTGFPLWVALACGFGLYRPSCFAWINPKWQVVGLALSMLGMGMTLTLDDLRGAMSMPKEKVSGFNLQYTAGFVVFDSYNPCLLMALCTGSGYDATSILMSGQQVVLAVCALHASGFFSGYFLSRMLGLDISSCCTIWIEVGMQNSVLGVVLAGQHFSSPLTAVPCAVSSV